MTTNLPQILNHCHISMRNYFVIVKVRAGLCIQPQTVWRKRTKTHDMGAAQSDSSISNIDLVSRIKQHVESADREKAKEIGGVFLFNVIKDTAVYSWTMDLNNLKVYEGEPSEDPDTTFTLNEQYFKQLVTGREDARVIMQAGRCSVTGDIMRAMKLEPYIRLGDKLK